MQTMSSNHDDNISTWYLKSNTLAFVKRKPFSSDEHFWWPCILFPSWSKAARSGFLLMSEDDSSTTSSSVLLEGYKKRVQIRHLAKNMVPPELTLVFVGKNSTKEVQGKSSSKKKNQQTKVVCYYLGLDAQKDTIANWAAVSIKKLKPFTKEFATHLLLTENKKKRKKKKKTTNNNNEDDLILAMKEASLVIEDDELAPENLLREIEEEKQKEVIDKDNHTDENFEDNKQEQTPEFFDQWKSQCEDSTQTQSQFRGCNRFSQAFNLNGATSLSSISKKRTMLDVANNANNNVVTPARTDKDNKKQRKSVSFK